MQGRRASLRYGLVVAVVLVIAGLFIQRELLNGDDDGLGLLDGRQAFVGREAPDFVLESARDTSQLVRLSDFRGQTVVLNFWSTWCPPCSKEMPLLQAVFDARSEAGDLVVLSVDFKEGAEPVMEFTAEFGITFPVVLDRSGSVAERYGLRGLPWTFFIDADGVIRRITRGPVFDELLPEGIAAADVGLDHDDGGEARVSAPELSDETGDVTVVNSSGRELRIVTNGQSLGTLAPGEERVMGTYRGGSSYGRFMAFEVGEGGERLFNRWLTWDDLVTADFRIVITLE